MVFVEASWNYYSVTIGTVISSIVIGIVLTVYIHNIWRSEKHMIHEEEYRFMQTVSTITLFFLFFSSILNATDYLITIPSHLCQSLLLIVWLAFGFYKGGLYVIYVSRLYIVFNGSSFQINRYLHYILWIFIILYFSIFIVIIISDIFISKTYHYVEIYSFCTLNASMEGLIFFAFYEFIFPMFCLILFIKPLIKLNKEMHRENKVAELLDFSLIRLAFKCTIITSIAVLSSILLITVVAIFGIWIPTPIDYIINCICIILYDSRYEYIYRVLCKYCDSKIAGNEISLQMEQHHSDGINIKVSPQNIVPSLSSPEEVQSDDAL